MNPTSIVTHAPNPSYPSTIGANLKIVSLLSR
jgi:hypothetical protein